MKINSSFYLFLILVLSLLYSCKKDDVTVKTTVPIVTIASVTNITAYSATCIAEISSDGGSAVIARGICWSLTNPTPTTEDRNVKSGTGSGSFTNSIEGLTQGATYYLRAYATNGVGTVYSSQVIFTTTKAYLPTINTIAASTVTTISATSGGNITNDGGSPVTSRGVCWSTSRNPTTANLKTTDGTGTGVFTSSLTGLTGNTIYYMRAYATNSVGTDYGSEISFITYTTGSEIVTDIDGNVYHTVTIGTQVWMVENLNTTRYRDGSPIPNVTNDAQWYDLTTEAYCYYYNDIAIVAKYGKLYNWYAVNTSKLAPIGWHVATDAEWTTLENHVKANLGRSDSASKALANNADWLSSTFAGAIGNDLTNNNSSGFTALPGGFRNNAYKSICIFGYWWSSTEYDLTRAWRRGLFKDYDHIDINYSAKSSGFSVRCVRD